VSRYGALDSPCAGATLGGFTDGAEAGATATVGRDLAWFNESVCRDVAEAGEKECEQEREVHLINGSYKKGRTMKERKRNDRTEK
jgi:hypothetical protein